MYKDEKNHIETFYPVYLLVVLKMIFIHIIVLAVYILPTTGIISCQQQPDVIPVRTFLESHVASDFSYRVYDTIERILSAGRDSTYCTISVRDRQMRRQSLLMVVAT